MKNRTSALLRLLHPEVQTFAQNLTELFQHPLLFQPGKQAHGSCFTVVKVDFLVLFHSSSSNLKRETCCYMKI